MNCTVASEAARSLLQLELAAVEEAAGNAAPGANGVVVLPFYNGERTPNLPHGKGCILGLNDTNMTPANIVRASMESAIFGLHAVEPKLIGSIPQERNNYAFAASHAEIPLAELHSDALGLETKRYPCGTRHQQLSRTCNSIRLQLVDIYTNNGTKNASRHSVNGERQC